MKSRRAPLSSLVIASGLILGGAAVGCAYEMEDDEVDVDERDTAAEESMFAPEVGEKATDGEDDAATSDVGVLGGCSGNICGTAINATSRGFHVTLLWGAEWSDAIIRWVGPYSRLGGNGVDVDGIHVGSGCYMNGVINGGLYTYPFVWLSGWHKIWTNETAIVNTHDC